MVLKKPMFISKPVVLWIKCEHIGQRLIKNPRQLHIHCDTLVVWEFTSMSFRLARNFQSFFMSFRHETISRPDTYRLYRWWWCGRSRFTITKVTRSSRGQKNLGKKSLFMTFQCASINIVVLNRHIFSGFAALAHKAQFSFLYQFVHIYAHTFLRSCWTQNSYISWTDRFRSSSLVKKSPVSFGINGWRWKW